MHLTIGTEDPTDRLLDPDTGKNKELTPGQWQSYICKPGERVVTLGRGSAANLYVNENNSIFHGRELEITYNPNDTITYFFPRESPSKSPQVHLTDADGRRIPPVTGYPQGETLLPKTVDGKFVGWQVTFKRDIVTADPTGPGRGVEVESDAGGEYKVTHQTTRVGQDVVLAQCRMQKRIL